MGPLATAVCAGCLEAMRWLLWLVAALLGALVIVQGMRGDENAQPLALLTMAGVSALAGAVCMFGARWIGDAKP